MLIVAGHFDVDPAARDRFIAEREDAMRRSRGEEGCLVYAMTADPLEPGRVLLVARWEAAEAVAKLGEALRAAPRPQSDIKVNSAEILQYKISEVGRIGS